MSKKSFVVVDSCHLGDKITTISAIKQISWDLKVMEPAIYKKVSQLKSISREFNNLDSVIIHLIDY